LFQFNFSTGGVEIEENERRRAATKEASASGKIVQSAEI